MITTGQIWKMPTHCTRAIRKRPQQYINFRVTANTHDAKHLLFMCTHACRQKCWCLSWGSSFRHVLRASYPPPSSCLIMLPVVTLLPALPYLPVSVPQKSMIMFRGLSWSGWRSEVWPCYAFSVTLSYTQAGPAKLFFLFLFLLLKSALCLRGFILRRTVQLHRILEYQIPKVKTETKKTFKFNDTSRSCCTIKLNFCRENVNVWLHHHLLTSTKRHMVRFTETLLCKHSVQGHLKNNKPHRDILQCCLMW